jgi:hypothetical protein
LLSRYIGSYGAESGLFGSILRTYISVSGVEWSEDTVCVFDGLQNVLDRCVAWYEEKLSAEKAGDLVRDDEKELAVGNGSSSGTRHLSPDRPEESMPAVEQESILSDLPVGVRLYVAEPITDRKSAFVGRACRIHHPSEVSNISLVYLPS